MLNLPNKKYNIILSDPPWTFKNYSDKWHEKHDESKWVGKQYNLMTLEDIKALPISDISEKDSCLFLWATYPNLQEALEVMKSWGFCCQVGTRVLTADLRWVNAETLRVGDRIVSFDENPRTGISKNSPRRYFQWGTILSTGIEPIPCYEITLSDGTILTSTGEHKWLGHIGEENKYRVNRWISTAELVNLINVGKSPKLMKIAPVEIEDSDYDAGFLAAAFDGEGSLTRTKWNFSFAQNENRFLTSVEEKLKNKGFNLSRYSYKAKSLVNHVMLKGGRDEALRFYMKFRPPRLLDKWLSNDISKTSLYNMKYNSIISVKLVGTKDVVTLMTDTGTYIAEGYGAHNTYKTVAFTWIKKNKKADSLFWGMGFWTRANAEIVLFGTKGHPKRISAGVHSVITEPVRAHSQKPDEVRERIVELLGDLPRIELFARERVDGWDAWGDQI